MNASSRGIAPGLGEPVFDKLEADLAKAMLSIPATKGFEIGSGFSATRMRGSEHNDAFEMRGGKVRTTTNYSGGVQGGISNGEDIYFRVAFKPTGDNRARTENRDHFRDSKANSRRADAMIRVFFREQCQWWKRWPRSCCAITRCGSARSVVSRE